MHLFKGFNCDYKLKHFFCHLVHPLYEGSVCHSLHAQLGRVDLADPLVQTVLLQLLGEVKVQVPDFVKAFSHSSPTHVVEKEELCVTSAVLGTNTCNLPNHVDHRCLLASDADEDFSGSDPARSIHDYISLDSTMP